MTKNKYWLFFVLYLSALCASLSQMKVVMLFPEIMETMNVAPGQVAWIMSVFTISGIILAMPGAAILGKLGSKRLLLCLLTAVIIGNLLGAFAGFFTMLIVSRIIEGIGFAMITMLGVVLVGQWFAGGNVGRAIGLFTTFPSLAAVICMNLTTPVAASLGLRSIWFIVASIAVVAFILVVFSIPRPQAAVASDSVPEEERGSVVEIAKNGKAWLLAVCMGCAAFVLFTFSTIYPQLYTEKYLLDVTTAGFYSGLSGIAGIFFCVLSGAIVDKFKNAPLLVLISFFGLAITCGITTRLSPVMYILHPIILSLFTCLILPAVLYIAPSITKKPALIPYSIAFVNMIYYVGIFAGAPSVMGAVDRAGWQAGANVLVGISVLGALSMIVFMLTNRKKSSGG